MDSTDYLAGATVTVSDKGSLALSGKTFVGWNTAADGSGTGHQPGDLFTMRANDVTFFAQWSANVYELTVLAGTGGAVTSPASPTIAVGHGLPTTIEAEPDSGMTFSEWQVALGSAIITDSTSASTSVVLEAGDATVEASFVDVTPPTAPTVSLVGSTPKRTRPLRGSGRVVEAATEITATNWTTRTSAAGQVTPRARATKLPRSLR